MVGKRCFESLAGCREAGQNLTTWKKLAIFCQLAGRGCIVYRWKSTWCIQKKAFRNMKIISCDCGLRTSHNSHQDEWEVVRSGSWLFGSGLPSQNEIWEEYKHLASCGLRRAIFVRGKMYWQHFVLAISIKLVQINAYNDLELCTSFILVTDTYTYRKQFK